MDPTGEEAKEMNEWIGVKDRLPENDNPVLIILNTKDQQPLVARFVKQFKRIAIIGLPGSGKSTFSIKLGKLLDIPAHHLEFQSG